jgi:hypothetical protein
MESIKTRLRNEISDYDFAIANKERIKNKKGELVYDAEALELKLLRDERKAQYDELFPKEPISDEVFLQRAIRAAERIEEQAKERLERAKRGDFGPKPPGRQPVPSQQFEAIKARTEAIREEIKELKDLAFPKKTPEEIALQIWRTRTANRTAELQEKLAKGDFVTTKRKPFEPSTPEDLRRKADLEVAKHEYAKALHEFKEKQRLGHQRIPGGKSSWRDFELSPRH